MNFVVLTSILFIAIAFAIIISFYAKRIQEIELIFIDMTQNCKKRRRRGDQELHLDYNSNDCSSCDEMEPTKPRQRGYASALINGFSFFENISQGSTGLSEYGAFYWN